MSTLKTVDVRVWGSSSGERFLCAVGMISNCHHAIDLSTASFNDKLPSCSIIKLFQSLSQLQNFMPWDSNTYTLVVHKTSAASAGFISLCAVGMTRKPFLTRQSESYSFSIL